MGHVLCGGRALCGVGVFAKRVGGSGGVGIGRERGVGIELGIVARDYR